jgi:TAG lipase/steryl ester hydrolase/phospholipase A2/LPA acyltransferase
MTASQLYQLGKAFSSRFSARARHIRQLEGQQHTSTTQDEWMNLAEQIDSIQLNDLWRSEPECQLYEADRVSARIDEFVHLMRRRDVFDLMFILRGGIARNKFGLLHEGLFTRALAGSKVLIETYHNVVCASLEFVSDAPVAPGDDPIPSDARLAFFNESRHAYGRTAMMLSGGAALGFFHVGVAKALMENGLMPRVLSGASAGSIVCAMIGTRTVEECTNDLFNVQGTDAPGHSGSLKLDFFRPIKKKRHGLDESEEAIGQVYTLNRVWQLLFPAGVRNLTSQFLDLLSGRSKVKDMLMSDTEHFRECCRVNIGDFTFQEAFDRSGRILNITVSPQNRSDPPRLLNYLTAPHVLVWSAAVASSSLPGVFESNRLLVREADGTERFESSTSVRFLDGSMEADLPMQQLSEMFNINHFIISQVNPHAVMFSDLGLTNSIWTSRYIKFAGGILTFVKSQLKSWIRNVVELIGGSRVAPIWETRRGFLTQFFTQEYVGRDIDITLNPWAGSMSLFQSFFYLLYNPSEADFLGWVESAERETWR